jgi:streptogramin lyase
MQLTTRPRRKRASEGLRRMNRETRLEVANLVYPLFVHGGQSNEPVASMPGVHRRSIPELVHECRELHRLGIRGVALFPVTPPELKDPAGKSFVNVRAMQIDRQGHLWFGGQQGAFRYDGKQVSAFTTKEGLLADFVGSMLVDRAGNVWMGHPGSHRTTDEGGASRYDGKTFEHFTRARGLNSGNVYCMLEDRDGNLWFGSVDAGLCRYDGKTFTDFSAKAPTRKY